jgi:hypothetical protein
MTVAVVLSGAYVVRAFLPHLVSLQYWSRTQPRLGEFVPYLPTWYAPREVQAIRDYFQGNRGYGVPWALWLAPLLRWSLLFLALFVGTGSLMLLLRRQWLQNERLSFPLLYLPLGLTSEGTSGIGPIFRQPLTWLGIGTAAAWNGLNIWHALIPAVPAPGFYFPLSGMFPDSPWTPLNSINLFFMLEAIGFGYFVSLEVSFSTWFFYLLEKIFACVGLAAGHEIPGFPFLREQSAGGYLGMALLILWGSRRHLAGILASFFLRRGPGATAQSARRGDASEERWACLGLVGSGAFVLAWCVYSGLAFWVAAAYLAVLFCFVLVYARLRAETGMPFEFVYPYALPKELVVQAFSVPTLLNVGGLRSMVIFSSLAWLSRHHYAESMAAYQADGLKLSAEARIPRRTLAFALQLALVVGLACAFWAHLDAYYFLGSNLAGGGTGDGEYRAKVALQEYQQMSAQVANRPPQDALRLWYAGGGFVVVGVLAMLRLNFPGSPFHPLGYLLATAYGDSTTNFFPMFTAWLLKSAILKGGGLKLYRTFVPFFLGLIVGHFFMGGIFWPALSLLLGADVSRGYHLYFGG